MAILGVSSMNALISIAVLDTDDKDTANFEFNQVRR
jgi:hypothetical protein